MRCPGVATRHVYNHFDVVDGRLQVVGRQLQNGFLRVVEVLVHQLQVFLRAVMSSSVV